MHRTSYLEIISTHFLNIKTPLQISYNLIFFLFLLLYDFKTCGSLTFEPPLDFPVFTTFESCYCDPWLLPHVNHTLLLLARRTTRTTSVCRSTDYRYTLINLCSSLATNDIHLTGINPWQRVKRTAIYLHVLDDKVEVLGNSQLISEHRIMLTELPLMS